MNLHAIVAPYISVVNPMSPVVLRISTGPSATAPDGSRSNTFATPGTFTGEIDGTTLTVASVAGGVLLPGQSLIDSGNEILPGTIITAQISGAAGGAGTYSVNQDNTTDSIIVNTFQLVTAQIQALSTTDLRQLEGLNLQGTMRAIYITGDLAGIVRVTPKGGDLVTLPDGTVWLITMVPEPWAMTSGWTKAVMTLQNQSANGGGIPGLPSLDFSQPGNSQYLPGLFL